MDQNSLTGTLDTDLANMMNLGIFPDTLCNVNVSRQYSSVGFDSTLSEILSLKNNELEGQVPDVFYTIPNMSKSSTMCLAVTTSFLTLVFAAQLILADNRFNGMLPESLGVMKGLGKQARAVLLKITVSQTELILLILYCHRGFGA